MSLVNTPYLIHAYDKGAYPRTHGKLFWLYYINDVAFPAGQGYRLVIRSGIGKADDAYYFLLERKMSGGRRCFVYCLGISENAGGLAILDLERNAVRKLMGLMHIQKDDKIYCFTFIKTKARC